MVNSNWLKYTGIGIASVLLLSAGYGFAPGAVEVVKTNTVMEEVEVPATNLIVNGEIVTVEDITNLKAELEDFANEPLIEDLRVDQEIYNMAVDYIENDNDFEEDLYGFIEDELNITDEDDFEYSLKNFDYDDTEEFYERVSVDDREDGDYVMSGKLKVTWEYLDDGEWKEDRDYVNFELTIEDSDVEDVEFSL